MARTVPTEPNPFPVPDGHHVVFLLDAATGYETQILGKWLRRQVRSPQMVRIKSSRRRHAAAADLSGVLDSSTPTYLIPVRVVWMAPEHHGRRSVGWSDIVKPGDPRDPRGIRARWIRNLHRSRVRTIAGEGASVTELTEAHRVSGEVDGLDAFVTRRAWRALDKVERSLRGNRYKISQFVPEAILSRGEFVAAINGYADESRTDPSEARRTAARYLDEIAATHSPYVIDLIANAIHSLYRQGYGEIRYSSDEVAQVAALGAEHPLVFLPSHRSNLDRLSLQFMLWENDLPPNHTAGGINLNFFPVGPLLRRTGVFFIRRSFRDNDLYKIVLRSYIDYLIEKRFPLEWYMEGGRSRSGKLNAPRFGLLNYVVDALRRGKSEDIMLIPVSIAYDQIQDVPSYAREAQGKSKERESLGWMLKAIRSLRQRYGDIYIRFGTPVSLAAVSPPAGSADQPSVDLQKVAFEVMYRIGRVTPVTPTAVVSIALLAARGKVRTADEIAVDCSRLVDFVRARNLPTTESLDLADAASVTAILEWLAEHGNVSSHEALERRVWWLDDEQMIRISYYRNVVVHFFVDRAIAEMSLLALAEGTEHSRRAFEERALALRDLLKFEFFFPDKDEFCAKVAADVEVDVPDWEHVLEGTGPLEVYAKLGHPLAFWALLPFLDAYQIVGDELERLRGDLDEKKFLQACLDRSRMYRIEDRLISGESASAVLFKSALALAANRNLVDDAPDVSTRRSEFAEEIRRARELAAEGL